MKNMIRRWRALWNPDMYHGWSRKKQYFEGWYFKVVDPAEKLALAIIPGISMDAAGARHAFIQVFNGTEKKAFYHEFPESDFQPGANDFTLQLGPNFFSGHHIRLDLPGLNGELRFQNPHPWPKMLGAPGIMGWYSFVPFMECYHGVLSLHHSIEGMLTVENRQVSFNQGIGYIEKDWGISFPSSWIWMQSNHFPHTSPVCLMASVARIPWLNGAFTGFIAGFLFEGQLHRFATYTGAKLSATLEDGKAKLVFQDKHLRLEAIGHPAEGAELISPLKGEMRGKVNESIEATIEVRFYQDGRLVFAETGRHGGLEVAGTVEAMLSELQ